MALVRPSPHLLALLCLGACSGQKAPIPTGAPVETPESTPDRGAVVSDTPPPQPSTSPKAPDTVPARATVPSGDRLYSKGRFAWIQPEPHPSKGWLGYLGLGSSIAVRGGSLEKARVPGSAGVGGCQAWYAVEPIGYVCAGDAATTDPRDPVVVETAAYAPQTDSPWPYDYGESIGAPRYPAVPTATQQHHDEWDFDDHDKQVRSARAGDTVPALAGIDLSPAAPTRWGAIPDPATLHELSPLVRESRKWIATGSTVAYTSSFDLGGRTFVVAHDHAIVPKDRIKPYPRSDFHGVELSGDVKLPLAFFRAHAHPKYRRAPNGTFSPTGEEWPRLAHVALTGASATEGKVTYLATAEPDTWLAEADASIVRAKDHVPAMVKALPSGRKTWVDVSILDGTLVAYEDDRPVFATLISPGRGGLPTDGVDPLKTASTPLGTFRVDGKFVTATMVSSTNDLLVHTEVQYVQNFHGPHALHGAYWHDAWGQNKSGGCINLSPIDARRLFTWTEPRIPTDWYGMRSVQEMGPATVVVVHR